MQSESSTKATIDEALIERVAAALYVERHGSSRYTYATAIPHIKEELRRYAIVAIEATHGASNNVDKTETSLDDVRGCSKCGASDTTLVLTSQDGMRCVPCIPGQVKVHYEVGPFSAPTREALEGIAKIMGWPIDQIREVVTPCEA